jgi:hypothetical protein
MNIEPTIVKIDSRKRITLGAAATAENYRMTVLPNGRIILDPAVVITEVERDYLANTEARAAVDRALEEKP